MTDDSCPDHGPADHPGDHPRDRPALRTQADLEGTWRDLMGPLGFADRSLWLMLVQADGRPIPQLTRIEACPERPDPTMLAGFAASIRSLRDDLAPGGRWAFLVSRPGGPGATDADRAWALGLVTACRAGGVPTEVVHLACDVDVVPLPYDVLAGSV